MLELDHLAVSGETLEAGRAHVEDALGVTLQPGGQHRHFGTHNLLLGLEDGLYLEVITVDPSAPDPDYPRWFDLDRFAALLTDRTKLVSVTHVSNVLGTVVPIAEVTRLAKKKGACVLIDGAQGVVHQPVDVQAIDCDFYAFTGHKLYGPTGIGVLYGKTDRLVSMPPWQGGGDMIEKVSFVFPWGATTRNKRVNVLMWRRWKWNK